MAGIIVLLAVIWIITRVSPLRFDLCPQTCAVNLNCLGQSSDLRLARRYCKCQSLQPLQWLGSRWIDSHN